MKTTINYYMERFIKVLLFYVLGTALSFWILALIRLNSILFYDYFGYLHWRHIFKNTFISGAPFGAFFWAFLAFKYPESKLDLKFIIKIGTPFLKSYLIGILLALLIIAGTQLYKNFFGADYLYATNYNIFGFSVLLGILTAIGFHTIKRKN